MPVLKEFICKAHGNFENFDANCPHGCRGTMVDRQFLTAPGFPQRAPGIDRTLDTLASDFNMTDMKHNSLGSVSGGQSNPFAPRWASGGLSGLQSAGHQLGDSGLKAVQSTFVKPESNISPSIKASSARELV